MAASSSYRDWGLSVDCHNTGDGALFIPYWKTQLVVDFQLVYTNVFYRVKKKSFYCFKHKVHLKPLAFNKNRSFCRMVNCGGNTRIDLPSNNGTPAPVEYSYIPVWESLTVSLKREKVS